MTSTETPKPYHLTNGLDIIALPQGDWGEPECEVRTTEIRVRRKSGGTGEDQKEKKFKYLTVPFGTFFKHSSSAAHEYCFLSPHARWAPGIRFPRRPGAGLGCTTRFVCLLSGTQSVPTGQIEDKGNYHIMGCERCLWSCLGKSVVIPPIDPMANLSWDM